ncbi:uncharacterized protein LOC134183870 isoform X2 [Corticium candelabrum]|uniref:uncharacterized protein LOC134183870 isoform X2 n=1 Tax=Corticium candelabrum TaxID=121492 RepID=UPI002E35C684|nr:uncharacterized protein LOC134183870 isoform X2 [Corticium candelabrum]
MVHRELHQACKDNDFQKVQFLVESGQVKLDYPDEDGLTPLDHASFLGHLEIARLLLKKGSSVHSRAKDGVSPIHTASLGGSVEMVKLLLQHGSSTETTTDEGLTPLHYAADGHPSVVRFLLDAGANVNAKTRHVGYTPLHKAAFGGHTEVIKILINAGADLEIKNTNGNTSLHVACREGHLPIAKLLYSNGASLQAKNKTFKTPRQLAEEDRQLGVIAWLDSLTSDDSHEVVVAIEDCCGGMEGHLAFSEGDFITVLKKPYEDWWTGRVGPEGKEGLFCTLLVDTRPFDQSEGIFTDPMRQEQNQAARWVSAKSDEYIKKATAAASGLLRTLFQDMSNLPLLADRESALSKIPELAGKKRLLFSSIKSQLARKDQGADVAVKNAEITAMDLVHAALQAHERQNVALRHKVHELEAAGRAGKERAQQIELVLHENSSKMKQWKVLMADCKQSRVFCSRLVTKLSEMFLGIKTMREALRERTCDNWDKSACAISLIGERVPLPGFSLFVGGDQQTDLISRSSIAEKVRTIAALATHTSMMDEVCIGTAQAVIHTYVNQIKQLTPVGAALLADGAVLQMIEYLKQDCPEAQGTFITIEALSRSIVFARRGNEVARALKRQQLPTLHKRAADPWTIHGVFRLTGIRLPNGRKYRGRDTRTDLYGYRNGTLLEAQELCMAPAGEEHTIGPLGGKGSISHSAMTATLYRRQNRREQRAELRQQKSASGMTGSRPVTLTNPTGTQVGPQSARGSTNSTGPASVQAKSKEPTSSPVTVKAAASGAGTTTDVSGENILALSYLHGNVHQLQAGAELNQAQMRAMFDRMCELSAQVDELKGQLKVKGEQES